MYAQDKTDGARWRGECEATDEKAGVEKGRLPPEACSIGVPACCGASGHSGADCSGGLEPGAVRRARGGIVRLVA